MSKTTAPTLLLFSCSDSFKEQYFSALIYLLLGAVQLFMGSVCSRQESAAFNSPQP